MGSRHVKIKTREHEVKDFGQAKIATKVAKGIFLPCFDRAVTSGMLCTMLFELGVRYHQTVDEPRWRHHGTMTKAIDSHNKAKRAVSAT